MVGLYAARLGKPTQYLFNNHTKNRWSGKTALPPHPIKAIGVSLRLRRIVTIGHRMDFRLRLTTDDFEGAGRWRG